MVAAPRRFRRRAFLAGLAAVAPLGSLIALARRRPGTAGGVFPPGKRRLQVENATAADFAPHVGSQFRLRPQCGTMVVVKLTDVAELTLTNRDGAHALGRTPFSIVFRGPCTSHAASGMVTMEHERLGTFSLFVAPVDRGVKATWYQAIFG